MTLALRQRIIAAGLILMTVIVTVGWDLQSRRQDQADLVSYGALISEAVWQLDRTSIEAQARLLTDLAQYDTVEITFDTDRIVETRRPERKSTLRSGLDLLPTLVRTTPILCPQPNPDAEADLGSACLARRDGPIGALTVSGPNRSVITYLWSFLGLLFILSLVWLILRDSASTRALQEMRLELERSQRMEIQAKLEEREGQLLEARRLESLGRLAAGVAHDFNNILTVILSMAELLELQLQRDPPAKERARAIRHSVNKGTNLTKQLLAFGRRQVMEPRPVSLNGLVRQMRELIEPAIGENITLSLKLDPKTPMVLADPAQLEQIVMNLAVNARDAMPRGGELLVQTIAGQLLEAENGETSGTVVLRIQDTGVGMDDATMARIFEPFFTTKAEGKGTGLGLSTVYGIVKQMGAGIDVESALGAGTRFSIFLQPTAAGNPANWETNTVDMVIPRLSANILVVEDRIEVLTSICEALRSCGYVVSQAGSAEEALELMADDEPLDLLITDVAMPGMNGDQLAQRLRDRDPNLKVLFVTGYAMESTASGFIHDEDVEVLEKPFGPRKLLDRVEYMLGR